MNPIIENSKGVFDALEKEVQIVQEQVDQLHNAVQTFVQSNGTGDGVRKKLRKKLKKESFLKACENCKKRK